MCHTSSPTDDQLHLDCECNRTTIDVHRGSQGIELALDAAQVAATRGNLTCRLGLSFRKSSPRIKQHPPEKRNQHPSCVYFRSSRNVLWVAVLICTILFCTILALRIRQGRKNQGGCDQSAGLANAVLRSRMHHPKYRHICPKLEASITD